MEQVPFFRVKSHQPKNGLGLNSWSVWILLLTNQKDDEDIDWNGQDHDQIDDFVPSSNAAGWLRMEPPTVVTQRVQLNLNLKKIGYDREECSQGETATEESKIAHLNNGLHVVEHQGV